MKETKKFFDNNCLNRGYSRVSSVKQSDTTIVANKYQHALPPIDMMEQYEEIHPGTCAKLFAMAEKEQAHRVAMDMLAIEQCKRATCLGRIFALVFIALISITTLMLVMIAENTLVAALFATSAFTSITIIAYIYSKSSVYKESTYNKHNNYKPKPYRNNRPFHNKPRR